MIEVLITDEMVRESNRRIEALHPMMKFSPDERKIYIGYLGEEIVKGYLGIPGGITGNGMIYDGKRVEVRSRAVKSEPDSGSLVSVESYLEEGLSRDDLDYYIFTMIQYGCRRGWIVGWYPCGWFFDFGTFVEKGCILYPGISFGKSHGVIMEVSMLKDIRELKDNKKI